MVSHRNNKIMEYGKGLMLVMLLVFVSTTGLAKTLISSTPIKEDNYDTPHQGSIRVYATLFSAPCNLSALKVQSQKVLLTGCGAGDSFAPHHVIFPHIATPAKLQFIDAQYQHFYPYQSISLQNGHNTVELPFDASHKKALRLEVNYD